jgi:hypothetical protein
MDDQAYIILERYHSFAFDQLDLNDAMVMQPEDYVKIGKEIKY